MARNLRKMSARKSRGQDKQAGKHKVEIIETKQEEMLKKKLLITSSETLDSWHETRCYFWWENAFEQKEELWEFEDACSHEKLSRGL